MLTEISRQYPRLLPLLKFVYDGYPDKFARDLKFTMIANPEKWFASTHSDVKTLLRVVESTINQVNRMCERKESRYDQLYEHNADLHRFILALSCVHDELLFVLSEIAKENDVKPIEARLKSGAELREVVTTLYGDATSDLGSWKPKMAALFQACYGKGSKEEEFYALEKHPRKIDKMIAVRESGVGAEQAAKVLSDYATGSIWDFGGFFRNHRRLADELAKKLTSYDMTPAELAAKQSVFLRGVKQGGGFFSAIKEISKKVEAAQQAAAGAVSGPGPTPKSIPMRKRG